MDAAGLISLKYVDFGSVLYGQNDQYYRIGYLKDESSVILLFISSNVNVGYFGIVSIRKNYKGGYFKQILGTTPIKVYITSDETVVVQVPSGELANITALGNKSNLISVAYGVLLPSDATEI